MDETAAETDLLAQAAGGDQRALERLLLAHYDRLYRRIAGRLPASLRGEVSEEDILQQTFIGVFQGIGSFQPRGKAAFYGWLCTIAEHRLRDALKARRAAKRGGGRPGVTGVPPLEADSFQELIEVLAGPTHRPSQSAARHEAAGAVQVGLASLKNDDRRAIELRYIRGLPVAEAAKAMGRTPRAIHNLCYRGLKQLRAVVGRSSQFLTRR